MRSIPLVAHVHTRGQVRRPDWTGRRSATSVAVSPSDFERAGVLSALSVCPDEETLRVDGEIRAAQFAAAFTFSAGGRLQLSRPYAHSLRDSTRTARAADFGQTVGWVVCQQVLGLPYVVDYERFCAVVGRRPDAGTKRPDYVAFASPEAEFFSVVECKGRWYPDLDRSTPSDWRTALKEAQAQADAGYEHLANRPRLGQLGVEAVVAIAALAHAPGRPGIVAQVVRDERAVQPWDLAPAKRQALLRLVYRTWGMAAGGEPLARAMGGERDAGRDLEGDRLTVGATQLWLPQIAGERRTAPFAMAALARAPNTPAISQPRHAITREALDRVLSDPRPAAATGIETVLAEVRGGDDEVIGAGYADGTALVDGQRALGLEPCSLRRFLRHAT